MYGEREREGNVRNTESCEKKGRTAQKKGVRFFATDTEEHGPANTQKELYSTTNVVVSIDNFLLIPVLGKAQMLLNHKCPFI